MNTAFGSCRVLQLGLALTLGIVALSTEAQTRSVRPVPQRQAPPLAVGAVGPGAPNPAGLPSPIPNPAGLTSQFPAGLPPPPADTSAVTAPANTATTTPPPITVGGVRVPASDGVPPQTAVMGYGAPAGPLPSVAGSGPYTALQIAQSFLAADANRDGELTRAEAQHLTIMPYSFEEMDRNHDGILTRFEYEDAMH
jgi:hypothetical protein